MMYDASFPSCSHGEWHQHADGSMSRSSYLRRPRIMNYETHLPADGSAAVLTVWGFLPNDKAVARAEVWRLRRKRMLKMRKTA